ncbi:MAG: hypothetical protein JNM62_09230 [Flavobacteriales bacterium]|nr:hypothetical protein [Flavobacteriales bacterium]
MDPAREKARLLRSKQDRLKTFIRAHPEQLDELFRFTDPEVRELAMTSVKRLDLGTANVLCDRITYLGSTRIVHHNHEVPRCRGKIIYAESDAHRTANHIWDSGRGRMRVYACPLCHGHHLTHTAHKDDDRQVA